MAFFASRGVERHEGHVGGVAGEDCKAHTCTQKLRAEATVAPVVKMRRHGGYNALRSMREVKNVVTPMRRRVPWPRDAGARAS